MSIQPGVAVNGHGRTIFVDAGDPRAARLVAADGNLNPMSLELWNAGLALFERPFDLIVDVGANYGEMLAGMSEMPQGRVVAVEANPTVAALLRRTCELLPFDVEVIEAAVGSVAGGRVKFAVDQKSSGTSHLASDADLVNPDRYELLEVTATTLDALFPDPVDFVSVKVDVEGAEDAVLAGAAEFFARSRLVAVMIEILHLPVQHVWNLYRTMPVLLWNARLGAATVLEVESAEELGTLLHSGEYYRQDAIVLAGREASEFDGVLRGRNGTTRDVQAARNEHQEALDSARAAELLRLRAFEAEHEGLLRQLRLRVDELERYLSVAEAQIVALAAAAKPTPDESQGNDLT